ncbi:MAG: CRISPR-associated protein Cas4 [Anaerolineales bacterium]
MLDKAEVDAPFRVTDLKQWVYCPRILYYLMCLPDVRPTTFKMEAGTDAGKAEEGREERRSLRAYGLTEGRREFGVGVASERYGLRGTVDMVIWLERPGAQEVIPVDYKLSSVAGEHFQLQVAAYGLLLEEESGLPARRGFLYEIPERRAEKINLEGRLRDKLLRSLEAMHHMLHTELMPAPTPKVNKCLACEFRRFCNDV